MSKVAFAGSVPLVSGGAGAEAGVRVKLSRRHVHSRSQRRSVVCLSPPPSTPQKDTTPQLQLNTTDTHPDESELEAGTADASMLADWTKSLTTVGGFAAALGLVALIGIVFRNGEEGAVVHAVEMFLEGPRFLVSLGMGVSAFIQALTGFGFAIVAVGGLTQLDWIVHSSVFDVVQPVAATFSAASGWALILPELNKVQWKKLTGLLIGSTLATPLGVALLDVVDGHLVLRTLGLLIAAYVAYALTGVSVPKQFGGKVGSWVLGVLAGALGGAFDITGPPLVVHGEAAGWDNADGTFRRNVLAVVSVNSSVVVLYDALVGRLNDFYYADFVKYAAPTVIVGIVVGNWLSTRLDAGAFKKIVLGTCMALGAKLILS